MVRVKDDLKRLRNRAVVEDAYGREVWRDLVKTARHLNGT